MQEQVRYAEHIRELLLLNAVNRRIKGFSVLNCLLLRFKCFQPACYKSAGTAGKVYCRSYFDTI